MGKRNPRRLRRRRRWEESAEDDPAAGLLNLFDLWMVFAIALLLSMLGAVKGSLSPVPDDARRVEERLRPTGAELEGEGQRLGIAYRLKSGEVVYVPDP